MLYSLDTEHEVNMKTLQDWLPYNYNNGVYDKRIEKHLSDNVVKEYGGINDFSQIAWPGKHRNVIAWCILDTGYAVGFNENPSVGWSFIIMKLKYSK